LVAVLLVLALLALAPLAPRALVSRPMVRPVSRPRLRVSRPRSRAPHWARSNSVSARREDGRKAKAGTPVHRSGAMCAWRLHPTGGLQRRAAWAMDYFLGVTNDFLDHCANERERRPTHAHSP